MRIEIGNWRIEIRGWRMGNRNPGRRGFDCYIKSDYTFEGEGVCETDFLHLNNDISLILLRSGYVLRLAD